MTIEHLRTRPLPMPDEGGKEQRGTVRVLGGSAEGPGAILLAGVAALRAGAGRLRIATVASLAPSLALAVPEARVFGLPEAGEIDPVQAGTRAPGLVDCCDAVLIGPGLSTGRITDALSLSLLPGRSSTTVVLDPSVIGGLAAHADAVRAAPLKPRPPAGRGARWRGRGSAGRGRGR